MTAHTSDIRQRLGAAGEQLAAEHLERLGFTILERNFRTRWGELDIVAFDGTTLVFCEVKSRRKLTRAVETLESVHRQKRSQVRRMAASWLVQRTERPRAPDLRFDAIGVTFDRDERFLCLEHLEGAF
jgi:putative endonuclease